MEKQIEIFISCIEHYFSKRSIEKIKVGSPYLTDNITSILSDFTGVISISGSYHGSVYFTAPKPFLEKIIQAHGQDSFSIEFLKDAIGEVVNTLSGNSRKQLGHKFIISVPRVMEGNDRPVELTGGAHSFVVPVTWYDYTASIVVASFPNSRSVY